MFGSTAYAHINDAVRDDKKLGKKAKKLIFVGYQWYSSNCRLFDSRSGKVIVAASVAFAKEGGNFEFSKTVGELVENDVSNNEEEMTAKTVGAAEQESSEDRINSDEEEGARKNNETDEDPTRRKLRDRTQLKKPKRFEYAEVNLAEAEPVNYYKAIDGPEGHEWQKAIKEEIGAHKKYRTWMKEHRPSEKQPITSKWLFKKKTTPGEKTRYKARLVARGFTQKYGVDFIDTYAPVVRYETLRVLLAEAATKDYEIMQFDVKTAFLYGSLKEEI